MRHRCSLKLFTLAVALLAVALMAPSGTFATTYKVDQIVPSIVLDTAAVTEVGSPRDVVIATGLQVALQPDMAVIVVNSWDANNVTRLRESGATEEILAEASFLNSARGVLVRKIPTDIAG